MVCMLWKVTKWRDRSSTCLVQPRMGLVSAIWLFVAVGDYPVLLHQRVVSPRVSQLGVDLVHPQVGVLVEQEEVLLADGRAEVQHVLVAAVLVVEVLEAVKCAILFFGDYGSDCLIHVLV